MKGIFTTKPVPSYDDLPEVRYHFPKTYLNQVERTVGDWIAYYEPRLGNPFALSLEILRQVLKKLIGLKYPEFTQPSCLFS